MDTQGLQQFLAQLVRPEGTPAPTLAAVEAAVAAIDYPALVASYRSRITVAVWDGKSKIGDADAAYLAAQYPWMDTAYTMSIDGQVVYFQSHVPHVEGYQPITAATVAQISADHASWWAGQRADAEMLSLVAAAVGVTMI